MPDNDDLPDALERLVALGQSPDVNIRPVLLRVVVDMFVGKTHHAPADLQQFEVIVGHLLDDADVEARLIVADKLSHHPATPRALLDRFIAEQGVIATKVYANACLDEQTLAAAAAWSSAEIALAVAGRADLSEAVVSALADRPEPEVVRELARNSAAILPRRVFQLLARRARRDRTLAHLLIARPADPLDLAPLFVLVRPEQRAAIIQAAQRAELGKRQWGRADAATAAALAHMDRLVLHGERDIFESTLCLTLGMEPGALLPLLNEEGGEVLALALAAAGASPEMAARVFILGDPRIGRSVAKVRALTALVGSVSLHAARRLLVAITGTTPEAPRRAAAVKSAPPARRQELGVAAELVAAPRREIGPGPARRRG